MRNQEDGPVQKRPEGALPLPRTFFERPPLECARALIGCRLRWEACEGIIVETEAYDAEGDEACHTFFKPSARSFVEKHPPGTAYVYLNYGVHWLFNVLVKGERLGFVLIRALEPTRGVELMIERRKVAMLTGLCSGPGKLTQAMGITGADHGFDLCQNQKRCLLPAESIVSVVEDVRIGINRAVHLPWRFLAAQNHHVSKSPSRFVKD